MQNLSSAAVVIGALRVYYFVYTEIIIVLCLTVKTQMKCYTKPYLIMVCTVFYDKKLYDKNLFLLIEIHLAAPLKISYFFI